MATILYVDDAPPIKRLVERILSESGHDVTVAPDGPTALRIAATRTFDLVVCDVMMPGMDGIELVRRMKRLDGFTDVPIIVVTVHGHEKLKAEARTAGAKEFLIKSQETFRSLSELAWALSSRAKAEEELTARESDTKVEVLAG